jgi:hypothetical protein
MTIGFPDSELAVQDGKKQMLTASQKVDFLKSMGE